MTKKIIDRKGKLLDVNSIWKKNGHICNCLGSAIFEVNNLVVMLVKRRESLVIVQMSWSLVRKDLILMIYLLDILLSCYKP